MKFMCECGHTIRDQSDYLPYKARLISDQDWYDFMDEIDAALEKSGPTVEDKEEAVMNIRWLAIKLTKEVYQCNQCGNMFFNINPPQLEMFRPDSTSLDKTLLKSAHGDK